MANNLKTEIVLDAIHMAIYNRRPQPGLIHHSDRGSQYISALSSIAASKKAHTYPRWALWPTPTTTR